MTGHAGIREALAGFDPGRKPDPDLTLTAKRLDVPGKAIAASSGKATNGWRDADDIGAFMLTGIELPEGGRWEVTSTTGTRTSPSWSRHRSNAKAKRELAWRPAHPSWRQGFTAA